MTPAAEPFLKWAGGKRWLVRRHRKFFPTDYDRYVEPFVGSGAVFFHLQPEKATLADRNGQLIDTYRTLRMYPGQIAMILKRYQRRHTKDFYYEMRASIPGTPIERAARFIYLNRVCWNGLYRVNLRGQFNVPIGTKKQVSFPDGFLERAAKLLRRARLVHSDFEVVIDNSTRGDFLYVDPPYTVRHNNNGFLKYNEILFSWADQIRLRDAVRRAARRGAKVLMTNAAHKPVIDLYAGFAEVNSVRRNSLIAGDSTFRGLLREVVFTINFSTDVQ
jgi:DNA adenine methylase